MAEAMLPKSKNSDYSSVDDLSIPVTRKSSLSDIETPIRERSNSDSTLNFMSEQSWSVLSVDKYKFTIGKDRYITVSWDVREDVGARDWIGLFPKGETVSTKFVDCKNRGVNGGHTGQIQWDIDAISHNFIEAESELCFKYYQGSTGDVLATSPMIVLVNPHPGRRGSISVNGSSSPEEEDALFRVIITDLEASNLKKGMFFNPDPYVKIQALPGKLQEQKPHHMKDVRSSIQSNTTNPHWEGEVFTVDAKLCDILDLEIKDKFSKSRPTISRFLGKASVIVQRIMDKVSQSQSPSNFSIDLSRRNPSDNISGTLKFKANIQLIISGIKNEQTKKRKNHQRKASLPADLDPQVNQNRNNQHRHRHTDPGFTKNTESTWKNTSEVIEEQDVSIAQLTRGRITDEEAAVTNEDSAINGSPPNTSVVPNAACAGCHNQTDSSDSGTSLTLVSSSDNSGGSITCTTATPSMNLQNSSDSQLGQDITETYSFGGQASLSTGYSCDAEIVNIVDSAVCNAENSSDPNSNVWAKPKNMVSQSQNAATSNSNFYTKDAQPPILPPRTYAAKVRAPPLPPRKKPVEAPPLPPRKAEKITPTKGQPGSNTGSPNSSLGEEPTNKLELPPPPLPPRTYSPIHMQLGTGSSNTEEEIQTSDRNSFNSLETFTGSRENSRQDLDDVLGAEGGAPQSEPVIVREQPKELSREQEVFPWGANSAMPSQRSSICSSTDSPDLANVPRRHIQKSRSRNSMPSLSDQLARIPSIDSVVSNSQSGSGSQALMSRSYISPSDSAVSTTVSGETPRDRGLGTAMGVTELQRKRRSHDGASPQRSASFNSAPVPSLQPRNRVLSEEEKEQNRLQIYQYLQLWSERAKGKTNISKPEIQVSGPSGATITENVPNRGCENVTPPPHIDSCIAASSAPNSKQYRKQVAHNPKRDSVDGTPTSSVRPGRDSSQTNNVWQSRRNDSPSSGGAGQRTSMASSTGSDNNPVLLPKVPARKPKYSPVDNNTEEEPLPAGWEARVDSHGRIFYIDHINRQTTWQRPQSNTRTVHRRPTISSEQRQQLDRRYQSIRRTITQSREQDGGSNTSMDMPPVSTPEVSPQSLVTQTPTERSVYKLPAVKFLIRPDFFPMLQGNELALAEYNRNSQLKHMITRIRRDAQTFERYQHNRDLVMFLNLFADMSKEVPRRWEMKLDRSGKTFFIDHKMKITTFIDPRLPTDVPLINTDFLQTPLPRGPNRAPRESLRLDAPVPPPRQPVTEPTNTAIPSAYNEKVVLFLRQTEIDDVIKEKFSSYSSNSSLRDKVHKIRNHGTEALDRLCNDIDLTILLSVFEQDIMSYIPPALRNPASNLETNQGSPQGSPAPNRPPARVPAPHKRDFHAKLRNFYRKLDSKGYGQGPGKLKLTVRRDHVLEDSFNKIMSTQKKELQKNKLYITFAGEEGLDYGGPSREFFFLLSRELFNPYYGLFEYSANDTYTVQISPMSAFVENAHEWFRFAGRVLGLALVHQYLLDAFFTRPFYKFILRVPWSLEDVETIDAGFYQSLLWIKDNDITDLDLDLTFSVSEEVFGQVTERELKPSGSKTAVTERNKKEYIEKMAKWRLERGVSDQTESLIRGFHEVVEPRIVSLFDARELELVIAGTVEIDITDWRKNTEYRSGYHDQHPVIQWFWTAISKFDNERRLRLLQFVTGTSSIPYEGFSALRGSNGPRKFCIEKWGKVTSLPRAHTCFNRLDLPPYTCCDMLFEKIVMAVEETSTFGIE
ncbi:E3 ubiquitin-protein ligase HECW2 [Patella vulgata]|uniref:E3 ubiquitin-protein ligase HECW2 n=1 Tax=Patella vulgata TaxID=6465 RepID=UPI0024A8F6BF|nr:E3 ubiquitin-protein ligase HECW2 [Patella vulgata]